MCTPSDHLLSSLTPPIHFDHLSFFFLPFYSLHSSLDSFLLIRKSSFHLWSTYSSLLCTSSRSILPCFPPSHCFCLCPSFCLLTLTNCIHFWGAFLFPSFVVLLLPSPPASSCPSLTLATLPMKSELGACFPAVSFPSPSLHHRCCRGSCRLYNLWMPQ